MAPGRDDTSDAGGPGGAGDPDAARNTRQRVEVPEEARHTRPIQLPDLSAGATARRPYLIVLAGPRVGEVIAVAAALLVGREPRSGLHLLDEGVSRRHCTVAPEGQRVRLTDLDSTNGTWIAGKRVKSHLLTDGDRFRVGQTTVIKFALQDAVEEQYQRQLFETALRDPLTRAFNRRYFLERLEAEVSYADRHQVPLALLCANVDRYEQVNRVVGRDDGDRLLRELASLLAGAIRTDDVLARLADDSFAVVARETGLDGGMKLAERLRGVVADALFKSEMGPIELRLSMGVAAAIPGRGTAATALMSSAQQALRSSKELGRNRVSPGELTGAPSAWVNTENFSR